MRRKIVMWYLEGRMAGKRLSGLLPSWLVGWLVWLELIKVELSDRLV